MIRQELAETQSQSRQELAAVKAEMQSQVDQLHSRLHYWQNTTVTTLDIFTEHCPATNSGKIYMPIPSTCMSNNYGNSILNMGNVLVRI